MHLLDWTLMLAPLAIVVAIALVVRRHVKSVADFVAGGRLADRYLLAVAKGEMQAGAVVFVAAWEVFGRAGFTITFWSWAQLPVYLILAISGFVIYRYRETRAMTLAQFFELRYSRRFRLFTGMLAFGAGLVNFGIIPAIGARVFVYLLGLPEVVTLLGTTIPTYVLLMGLFLSVAVFLTLAGGLVTLMITDCVEGILSQFLYLIIIAGVIFVIDWSDVTQVLTAQPAGQSMLNPFDSQAVEDFNIGYVIMGLMVTVYGTMAWQNASAYNAAAYTAHESRMSNVLGRWREMGKAAVVTLLAVAAITYLRHPELAAAAQPAQEAIGRIGQAQIREQMQVPVALSYLLPIGVKGALCAVLLMGIFGGDSTHLHSWSGIFVQDVLVPLRRKPFTPEQHIRILRWAVVGVATFAFIFGALFRQTEYVLMWWHVTQAIYVGGAGAAIIGGLYWRKGTTAGAWSGLLTGSVLSAGGILLRQIYGRDFPLNGLEISFYATLCAIAVYVLVSLATCRENFNLERMLHRGPYAVGEAAAPVAARRPSLLARLIGIDDNFTRGDKWIAGGLFGWSMTLLGIVVLAAAWNLFAPWPAAVWAGFWQVIGIGVPIVLAVVTAVWFFWGGVGDIRRLFRRLAHKRVNHLDDGSVVNHQNLDEAVPAPAKAE